LAKKFKEKQQIIKKIIRREFVPQQNGEYLIEYSKKTERFTLSKNGQFLVSDICLSVIYGHAEDLGVKFECFENVV
jgi:hypothetical protein